MSSRVARACKDNRSFRLAPLALTWLKPGTTAPASQRVVQLTAAIRSHHCKSIQRLSLQNRPMEGAGTEILYSASTRSGKSDHDRSRPSGSVLRSFLCAGAIAHFTTHDPVGVTRGVKWVPPIGPTNAGCIKTVDCARVQKQVG